LAPFKGQKVFTLQTLPASPDGEYGQLAHTSGFSLHAGVFANADDPLNFIGKLAALIPPPRINLIRFYGFFAPNSKLRAQVTASKRGKKQSQTSQ
jgi:hypothetical protein